MHVCKAVAVVCLFPYLLLSQAQSTSGDVRGSVVDSTGGSVARARVTITDPDRGITRGTESNAGGEFAIPLLPPGRYRLRVEAAGFSTTVLDGL
jgi:hypothetical protein